MEKKVFRIVVWFFSCCAVLILISVVLELAGYNNVMYKIGYVIGHFLRTIVNLF